MLYNQKQLQDIKRKTWITIIILLLFFLLTLAHVIFSIFRLNDQTFSLITTVNCVIFSVFAVVTVYVILNVFIPFYRRYKVVETILLSNEQEFAYNHYEIGEKRTIDHTEKAYQITLSNEKETYYFNLDARYASEIEKIKAGHKVKIRNSYITEIIL